MSNTRRAMKSTLLLMSLVSTTAIADYIQPEYNTTDSSCKVTYQYFNGEKNRVTCSASHYVNDKIEQLDCSGSQEVGYVNHNNSAILISASETCSSSLFLERIKVKKTRGKDKSKEAKTFDGSKSFSYSGGSGQIGANLLWDRVAQYNLCYREIDISSLKSSGATIKVKFNEKKTYTKPFLGIDFGGETTCHKVLDGK